MCGVIGIINTKDVVGDIYLGLLCLQHRGQDSAGISTFDASTNQLLTKKAPGLVQEIFSCEQLKKLKGNVGIGHTRYPTVGSDVETDTQPFVMNSGKKIAMGHNGNLTNYYELKEKLRLQGVLLDSTCDVEPVLHIFANEFERTHNIFSSVNKVYQNIAGSYSVVALVEDGLLAFRDPKGIRPLVMGR